jgi:hypothetical protein
MTKRQRIFFRIGASAMVVTSFIHIAGALAGEAQKPSDPTEAELMRLMTTYYKDMGGGILRSRMDLIRGFSHSYSILILWIGVLGLILLRRHSDASLMRLMASACAIFSLALLTISAVFFFWPPTICCAVIFLAFAGAAVPSR